MVQRLDRSRDAKLEGVLPAALDLAEPRARFFNELPNLPLRGMAPSSNGTLLIWIPTPWFAEGQDPDPQWVERRARQGADKVRELLERTGFPQPFAVAVPAAIGEERVAALREELGCTLVTHALPPWSGEGDPETPDMNRRWIFFVDSSNVIRVVLPLAAILLRPDFDDPLLHWLEVFRDHGRPERDLPEYGREMEEE
jgi:hypothetical protein